MSNEKLDNITVIKEKYSAERKKCMSDTGENIDKIVEEATNRHIRRRCDNPLLKKTERLIEELGGPRGVHRILRIRIDRILIDKKKKRYVVGILDFYECERYYKKGYAYRCVECCISENLCRPRKVKSKTQEKYNLTIKIGANSWVCWSYANSKALIVYLKYYVLIPFRRNTKGDVILRGLYKKIGLIGELPKIPMGRYTRICQDPYKK